MHCDLDSTRSRALVALLAAALLAALPAPLAAQHGRSAQATAVARVEVVSGNTVLPDSVTARRLAVAVPMRYHPLAADSTVAVLPDRRRAVQIAFVGN